jgi:hypothetical protein
MPIMVSTWGEGFRQLAPPMLRTARLRRRLPVRHGSVGGRSIADETPWLSWAQLVIRLFERSVSSVTSNS